MNPIVKAIEGMFSTELSGSKWRGLSTTDVQFIYGRRSAEEIKKYEATGQRFRPPLSIMHAKIVSKLKALKTVEAQVVYLNERMIGE